MKDGRRIFLERKRAEVRRALMDSPKPFELELTETVAFERLFDVLETDM